MTNTVCVHRRESICRPCDGRRQQIELQMMNNSLHLNECQKMPFVIDDFIVNYDRFGSVGFGSSSKNHKSDNILSLSHCLSFSLSFCLSVKNLIEKYLKVIHQNALTPLNQYTYFLKIEPNYTLANSNIHTVPCNKNKIILFQMFIIRSNSPNRQNFIPMNCRYIECLCSIRQQIRKCN